MNSSECGMRNAELNDALREFYDAEMEQAAKIAEAVLAEKEERAMRKQKNKLPKSIREYFELAEAFDAGIRAGLKEDAET